MKKVFHNTYIEVENLHLENNTVIDNDVRNKKKIGKTELDSGESVFFYNQYILTYMEYIVM